MMSRILARISTALTGLALLAQAHAEVLTIPGSGNPEYVLGVLAKAFNAQSGVHRVEVPPSSGTAGALRDVEQGVASLGRVGRPLKEVEQKRGLKYLPFGRDAVVFVGGAGVTAQSISAEQAVAVYTGKVSDWRELGAKPGPIRPIGREATDASRQALARAILEFSDIAYGAGVKLVHLDTQLIELLDRYPTSLGFLNRSALFAATTALKPLAFGALQFNSEALADGRYPLALEFGLVHKAGALSAAGKAFVAFVYSPSGERILREHGVLPLPAAN